MLDVAAAAAVVLCCGGGGGGSCALQLPSSSSTSFAYVEPRVNGVAPLEYAVDNAADVSSSSGSSPRSCQHGIWRRRSRRVSGSSRLMSARIRWSGFARSLAFGRNEVFASNSSYVRMIVEIMNLTNA